MDKEQALVEAQNKLLHGHRDLREKVVMVIEAMYSLGFPVRVVEGERTAQRQAELYAKGRTTPGPIVTNCDGVTRKSKHQQQADGYCHAADVVFVDENGQFSWDMRHPWALLGAMAEALGLTWGGSWTRLRDYPHMEI